MPLAWAISVQVKTVKTNYGLKVLFEGVKEDFEMSYAEGVLTLVFGDVYEFEDLKKLTKDEPKIKAIQPIGRVMNIIFSDSNLRIEKLGDDSSQKGVNIYHTSKEKKDSADEVGAQSELQKTYKLPIYRSQTEKNVKYTFDWATQVGAAAFKRSGYIWIVFNKAASINANTSEIKSVKTEEGASVIKIKIDDESKKYKNILMYSEGNKWILEYSNSTIKPRQIRVLSRPYAAPQPRVEIEFLEETAQIVPIRDEDIGDDLWVMTTTESATNIPSEYKFVDFAIIQSVQGAVLQKLSDSLASKKHKNIVSIEGSNALNIAPKVLRKSHRKLEDVGGEFKLDSFVTDSLSILNIKSYKVRDEDFYEKIYDLRMALANATSKEKRSNILANWATFNLANDLYAEGLIVIKMLYQEDPDFAASYNIKLIEAALKFMNKDYMEAYKVVRKIDILDVPISLRKEMRFWQAIVGYMVSNAEDYLDIIDPAGIYIQDSNSFITEYSDPFMVEFGFAVANSKLKSRYYADAKKLIERIGQYKLTPHQANNLLDLKGVYFSKMDDSKKAIENWDKCIENLEDYLHYTTCRYHKLLHLERKNSISRQEYIKELEGLSILWRGDELEVRILKDLGESYVDEKDYINALRSWKKIIDYFPYSPDALMLSRRMGETFVDFFLKHRDDGISHLQAAAIFYEFENLNPIGEVGDDVVLRFVDHLVALDLLSRATALLNHQIMYRLKGQKREIAINKLAKLYIMNKEPALAIDAINIGDFYEELPDYIGVERKYIHADALLANEEYEGAITLLEGDLSQDADDIRSDIYWVRQTWKDFNKNVEPRIYKMREHSDDLVTKDAERVLKLAISYLIIDEQKLLDDLVKDFKNRLPQDNLKADIMRLLAQTLNSIDDNSVDALKDKTTIEERVTKLLELLSPDPAQKDEQK